MKELLKELEELKQKIMENEKKIVEIEKKIEEKQAETGRWKPGEREKYWFIDRYGQVINDRWTNHVLDNIRYENGNCFQSSEEAEFAIEKLKIIIKLKEFAEPKNRAWDGKNEHFFFYYDYMTKEVRMSYNNDCKSRKIYFESEEKVKQAIASIGEDKIKKYYLEVEEE